MYNYDALAILNAIQTVEPIVDVCSKARSPVGLGFTIQEYLLLATLYQLASEFIAEYDRLYRYESAAIEE